jgi:4-hydroxy-tetrahydrodipicolinate synthase
MTSYRRLEARDWARERLQGVMNVVIPTFTNDLADVNEAAIRFDVRREIELGFTGALMVAETATTQDEYIRFVEWVSDEARGRLIPIFHASFDTLEDNIQMAKRAEAAGAELVLLSYPPTFYPSRLEDILDYTAAFCGSTDLAVMLFPVPLWGFERLHPASIPVQMLERMVDEIPTVVAIKAEGGYPHLGGFAETWNRLSDRVVISMPIEVDAIPLSTLIPLRLIATSNTECLAARVPTMLQMCRDGKSAEAMELYWRCEPVRKASERLGGVGGANAVHRMGWKYQAWLTGFNGGPLRQPTARLVSGQMKVLRAGAAEAGVIEHEDEPDDGFFIGRNPN